MHRISLWIKLWQRHSQSVWMLWLVGLYFDGGDAATLRTYTQMRTYTSYVHMVHTHCTHTLYVHIVRAHHSCSNKCRHWFVTGNAILLGTRTLFTANSPPFHRHEQHSQRPLESSLLSGSKVLGNIGKFETGKNASYNNVWIDGCSWRQFAVEGPITPPRPSLPRHLPLTHLHTF